MFRFLQRNFDIVIAFGLATFLALSVWGCGETPTAPTPTPDAPPVVVPAPPPVVVLPAVEPFCPYTAFTSFRVTEVRAGVFQFSWDVVKDSQGAFLKRYQIQVLRNGKEFTFLEAEAERLGGAQDRTVFYEWAFPGTDPGSISARIRVHYPHECRDEGTGNERANGPWSDPVDSTN